MNKSTLSLWFFASLICNASCSANSSDNTIELTAKENNALSIFLPSKNAETQWLDASETLGLFLPASEIPDVPLNMGGLSSSVLGSDAVITTYDANTHNIQVWHANLDAITEMEAQRFSIGGIETLCTGEIEGKLQTFVVDDLGMLHQYALIDGSKPIAIRHFAIGPGIKSCAVDSSNAQVWLADETAGVWTMDAHPESEITRELVFTNAEYTVEGVASITTANAGQITAWVSPDKSGMWIHTQCETTFVPFNSQITPEILTLGEHASGVVMSVYDDDSGQVYQGNYPIACNVSQEAPHAAVSLFPSTETTPVNHTGDAADDPAIWVNNNHPEQSLVLGTNKKGGLAAYDLTGKQTAWLPVGRVNNVDVRYNVDVNGATFDVAVASNRTYQSMSVFLISQNSGALTHLSEINTTLNDVYGFCLYQNEDRLYGFINDTSGQYALYEISIDEQEANGTLVHSFTLPSQPEGCVVDDATNTAFLGEEGAGIWTLDLNTPNALPEKVITISLPVEADIEGLGLYWVDGTRYLIASSQGNNQYAIYQSIHPFNLVGMINIAPDWRSGIDGVSETDGLDITNANLGGRYQDGMFVVQDGRNVMPTENQNFKFVEGSSVMQAIRTMLGKR